MNKKEAEDIAWELYKVLEDAETVSGKDRGGEIANSAMDSIHNIIRDNPKIKKEIDELKTYEVNDTDQA